MLGLLSIELVSFSLYRFPNNLNIFSRRTGSRAIVLAKNLIHRYAGRTYVNILKDGLKEEKYVIIGIETSNEVEIVSGLDEGEQVIRD